MWSLAIVLIRVDVKVTWFEIYETRYTYIDALITILYTVYSYYHEHINFFEDVISDQWSARRGTRGLKFDISISSGGKHVKLISHIYLSLTGVNIGWGTFLP